MPIIDPQSKQTKAKFLHLVCFAVLLIFALSNAHLVGAKQLPGVVDKGDGKLTIEARQVSLLTLLQEISDVTGIGVFVIDEMEDILVSVEFKNTDVEKILGYLLKNFNYAVVYGTDQATGSDFQNVYIGNRMAPTITENADEETSLDFYENEAVGDDPQAVASAEIEKSPQTGTSVEANPADNSNPPTPPVDAGQNQAYVPEDKYEDNLDDDETLPSNSIPVVKFHASVNPDAYQASPTSSTTASDFGDTSYAKSAAGTPATSNAIDDRYQSNDYYGGNAAPAGSGRAARIQSQIEMLERRIESGQSDRDYEQWAAVKGEKYVTHDKERLAYYQKQLSQIQ